MRPTKIDYLENIAPVGGGSGSLWILMTTKPLAKVTPGYLNGIRENSGLKRHDRIYATCSMNEVKAEYASLVVATVDERGKVKTLEALP